MTDSTRPSHETREAERREAQKQGTADRAPRNDEEARAEELPGVSDSVREHERDMAERGVHQEGEGRIG